MGINFQQTSLSNYLLCWSAITVKNEAHRTIIQTLPIVICWNLWKNICSAKYGGKKSSVYKEIRVTRVIWKLPPPNRYKLNTDGSALHNPGKIGGGGILRDEQGIIIYAFVVPFGVGTNNQAEVQAACFYSSLEDTQVYTGITAAC
ncbi:hypothetical protein KY290_033603 [Solanum tuberosum]|uniref:RNase H type-1 domain-containing protein n=1 Tax=Solanum tuberosum TaxID=4113 RepID=A0ABQ7U122_SOLTU|nr:hypothetical protein KY290_033603 [Solanum tuberosum]